MAPPRSSKWLNAITVTNEIRNACHEWQDRVDSLDSVSAYNNECGDQPVDQREDHFGPGCLDIHCKAHSEQHDSEDLD